MTVFGGEPKEEESDGELRKIKLENARINLEIQELQSEKLYYEEIVHSIRELLEQRGEDQGHDLTQRILDILTVDPEP